MRRIQRLAIVITTATAVVLGSAGVASAEVQAEVTIDNQVCANDDTTDLDLTVTITGDAAEDTFDIKIVANGLNPDPSLSGASGGVHEFPLVGLGDGLLAVLVTHAETDVEYARWFLVLECKGPIVQALGSCAEAGGFIFVSVLTGKELLFDISIDEALVGDGVTGADNPDDFYTYGPFDAGQHTVEVAMVDVDAEPWTFDIDVPNCDDADSGAGIPTVGSDTAPLVATAAALMLLGGALVLVRRTRTA